MRATSPAAMLSETCASWSWLQVAKGWSSLSSASTGTRPVDCVDARAAVGRELVRAQAVHRLRAVLDQTCDDLDVLASCAHRRRRLIAVAVIPA